MSSCDPLHLLTLPSELILQILSHLSYTDLLRVALVSRALLPLTRDEGLWAHLCQASLSAHRRWAPTWRATFCLWAAPPLVLSLIHI